MSEAEAEEEEVLSLGTSDEADMCQEPGNEEESTPEGYYDTVQDDEYAQDKEQPDDPHDSAPEQLETIEAEPPGDVGVQHHEPAEDTRHSQNPQGNGFVSKHPQHNHRQQQQRNQRTTTGPGRGRRGGPNGPMEGQQRLPRGAGVSAGQHVWIPAPPVRGDMQAGFAGVMVPPMAPMHIPDHHHQQQLIMMAGLGQPQHQHQHQHHLQPAMQLLPATPQLQQQFMQQQLLLLQQQQQQQPLAPALMSPKGVTVLPHHSQQPQQQWLPHNRQQQQGQGPPRQQQQHPMRPATTPADTGEPNPRAAVSGISPRFQSPGMMHLGHERAAGPSMQRTSLAGSAAQEAPPWSVQKANLRPREYPATVAGAFTANDEMFFDDEELWGIGPSNPHAAFAAEDEAAVMTDGGPLRTKSFQHHQQQQQGRKTASMAATSSVHAEVTGAMAPELVTPVRLGSNKWVRPELQQQYNSSSVKAQQQHAAEAPAGESAAAAAEPGQDLAADGGAGVLQKQLPGPKGLAGHSPAAAGVPAGAKPHSAAKPRAAAATQQKLLQTQQEAIEQLQKMIQLMEAKKNKGRKSSVGIAGAGSSANGGDRNAATPDGPVTVSDRSAAAAAPAEKHEVQQQGKTDAVRSVQEQTGQQGEQHQQQQAGSDTTPGQEQQQHRQAAGHEQSPVPAAPAHTEGPHDATVATAVGEPACKKQRLSAAAATPAAAISAGQAHQEKQQHEPQSPAIMVTPVAAGSSREQQQQQQQQVAQVAVSPRLASPAGPKRGRGGLHIALAAAEVAARSVRQPRQKEVEVEHKGGHQKLRSTVTYPQAAAAAADGGCAANALGSPVGLSAAAGSVGVNGGAPAAADNEQQQARQLGQPQTNSVEQLDTAGGAVEDRVVARNQEGLGPSTETVAALPEGLAGACEREGPGTLRGSGSGGLTLETEDVLHVNMELEAARPVLRRGDSATGSGKRRTRSKSREGIRHQRKKKRQEDSSSSSSDDSSEGSDREAEKPRHQRHGSSSKQKSSKHRKSSKHKKKHKSSGKDRKRRKSSRSR